MLLRVGLAEEPVEATVPGNARGQAPRVVDLEDPLLQVDPATCAPPA